MNDGRRARRGGFFWGGVTMAACLGAASLCLASSGLASRPAAAETLTFAGAAPPLTFDPDGTNDYATMAIYRQVYDSLLGLTDRMEAVPGLAAAWQRQGEAGWRFHLRPDIVFHDGTKLRADDIVFSILREKGSGYFSSLFGGITDAVVVDESTIDVVSKDPDPILPAKMTRLFVMSRDWALAHDLAAIPNLGAKGSEAFSVRHANGTGPMRLKSQEPGIRTILERFPGYWGQVTGNVTEATYLPIGDPATRVAALLSRQVDAVIDVPLQDVDRVRATPGFVLRQVPQMQWMQLELDGTRDVALGVWDKAGQPLNANPFKDPRVRMAIAQAVDAKLIVDRVLRGNARVVGIPAIPDVPGYAADLDTRWPTDVPHAKALLVEAGYPAGFTTQLNCPTERYASAEEVCRAVAGMLGRIGIEVRVNNMVWPDFARMLVNGPSSSFHLIGAGGNDTQDVFVSDMMTRDPKAGEGFFNWALWHNDELDKVARELRVTFDPAGRQALYRRGLEIAKRDVYAVTLYQPLLSFGSTDKVQAMLRADAMVILQNAVVH